MVVSDGRYTGEIDFYAYAENKASAVLDLAQRYGYELSDSYAYSDSVTDIPMLSKVGHPFVVNPDRALRREAGHRNWPVLEFNHPVRLRDRVADHMPHLPAIGTPRASVVAAIVSVTAVVTATVVVWLTARRRPSPA
jgi:hypothetical protein